MQLIFDLLVLGAIFYLVIFNLMFDTRIDVSNLYSSRDRLWKEFFKLQQTSKRRDKVLRSRIHNLERKVNGITRRQEEAQQEVETET